MGKTQLILDFVSCGRAGPGGPGQTQGGKTHIILDFVSCGRPGPGGPGKTPGGKTQIILDRKVACVMVSLSPTVKEDRRRSRETTTQPPFTLTIEGERERETITQPPLH